MIQASNVYSVQYVIYPNLAMRAMRLVFDFPGSKRQSGKEAVKPNLETGGTLLLFLVDSGVWAGSYDDLQVVTGGRTDIMQQGYVPVGARSSYDIFPRYPDQVHKNKMQCVVRITKHINGNSSQNLRCSATR